MKSAKTKAKAGPKERKALQAAVAKLAQKSAKQVKSPKREAPYVAAPAAVGAKGSGSYFRVFKAQHRGKDAVRVVGRDYLATVNWTGASVAGTTLYNNPLNPTVLFGSRLKQLADTYEKYKFNRFAICVTPGAPTELAGSYGISYDRDPSDLTPADDEHGVREFMGYAGTKTSSAFLPMRSEYSPDEPLTDLFVNPAAAGDERLCDQGQVYIWVASKLKTAAGTDGNIDMLVELEYDLTLYIPQSPHDLSSVQYHAAHIATDLDLSAFEAVGGSPEALFDMFGGPFQPADTNTTFRGDVTQFPLRFPESSDVASAIFVPQGVWDLVITAGALSAAAGAAGNWLGELQVSLEAVNTGLQSLALVVSQFIASASGPKQAAAALAGNVNAFWTLVVPIGGAWLTGALKEAAGAQFTAASFAVKLLLDASTNLDLSILVGATHPGKLGKKVRAELRELESQKAAEREREHRAFAEQFSLPLRSESVLKVDSDGKVRVDLSAPEACSGPRVRARGQARRQ